MYYTQFESDIRGAETEPKPGLSSYGIVAREVPEILMPRALETLVQEYQTNSYVAYPIGFYKEVHLTEKKRKKMAEIIGELTGEAVRNLIIFLRRVKMILKVINSSLRLAARTALGKLVITVLWWMGMGISALKSQPLLNIPYQRK